MQNGFIEWLYNTAFSQALNASMWAIPAIQTVHIIALAVLFSSALIVALRVMGGGLVAEPLASVAARFLPPIGICLLVQLASGALLIIAEPDRTLVNTVFYIKMGLLLLAVGVTLFLRAAARGRGAPGPVHSAAAVVSLLLWAATMVAGRYIAYT